MANQCHAGWDRSPKFEYNYGMSEWPTHPVPGSATNGIDLYCLECGYNLRGLSGDPRRCPECGHLNPMGYLELPAEIISAQLRRMETAPTVCVGAVLFGGTLLSLLVFIIVADGGRIAEEALACMGVPAAVAAVAWVVCAIRFRKSCMYKPGWEHALWRYHVHGLGLSGAVLCPLIVQGILLSKVSFRTFNSMGFAVSLATTVFIGFAALTIIGVAGPRARRRLKQILTPLQREVAVAVAREVLRRRLRSRRRR